MNGWLKKRWLTDEIGPGKRIVDAVAGGSLPAWSLVKESSGKYVATTANDTAALGLLVSADAKIANDVITVNLDGVSKAKLGLKVVALEKLKAYASGTVGPALTGSLVDSTITSSIGTAFTNQPANDGIEVGSSSAADVVPLDVYGTTNGGVVVVKERIVLTGTTFVSSAKLDWGLILGVEIPDGYPAAIGTITIREASGNAAITTITPGNRSSGVVNVTNTTTQRAFNRPVRVTADGSTTKVVGVVSKTSAGVEQLTGLTLSSTAVVASTVSAKLVNKFLVGDLEVARTATLKTFNVADTVELVGRAAVAGAEGDVVEVLFERSPLADLGEERTLRATGTIPFASVRTMFATPVVVIPAPGPGKYIQVERCHWFLDFASAAYDGAAAGETLDLRYTNAAGATVVDSVAGNAIGSASADYHTVVAPVAEVIPVANAQIVAAIATAEWFAAAGDSPIKYDIAYKVKTLEFV